MGGCSAVGCLGERTVARGYCAAHYARLRKYGDVLEGVPINRYRTAAVDRFWSRVDKSGDCWEWIGYHNPDGYAVAGKGVEGHDSNLAHRISYEIVVGPIPDGLVIDHLCRNRGCLNPLHLEPVTNVENLRRGHGVGARNGAVTHCPANHPYDEANTLYEKTKRGGVQRKCRACKRASCKRKYAARRAKQASC